MDQEERGRRRKTWDALSDAFLDTEVRWYLPRIARVVAECGYSAAELERIWHREMVPECAWNLLQVAGEWAALPLDYDRLERLAEDATLQDRLTAALGGAVSAAVTGPIWPAIRGLHGILLALEPAERKRRESLYTAFAHFYIETDRKDLLFAERHEQGVHACAYSAGQLMDLFEREFRPIYRTLLFGSAESGHAHMVHRLIAAAGDG